MSNIRLQRGSGVRDLSRNATVVGRQAEMETLLRALEDSGGGLILIAGEGGVGKSRLVREAATAARERGRPVVWARPEQIVAPGPFALIVDLVENVAASGTPQAVADAESLAAALMETPEGADSVVPRRIAARLRGLLAHGGPRPVVILEDLQSADEASHAVVVHLARSAADDGRLLIATYRSEDLTVGGGLTRFLDVVSGEGLASYIDLSPLTAADAISLAAEMLGPENAGQAQWIASAGEGIPFFIEELATEFRRTGSTVGVPETIARAALARRQQLGPVARHVLAAAAVAAGPIDARMLAIACDLDDGAVARALAEAGRAGIVEDRQGRLAFRHALVREAFVEDLLSVERQQVHRTIAAAIEQAHADSVAPHARSLADHWYQGHDPDRALPYALEAGDRALAMAALTDARTAYELALACTPAPSGAALSGLAEVEVRQGATDEAASLFLRAAEAYERDAERLGAARARSRLAWVYAVERRRDDALAVLHETLESLRGQDGEALLAQDGEALLAQIMAQRGRLLPGDGAELRAAAAIAERIGEHSIRADALEALAFRTYAGGDAAGAVEMALDACRSARIGRRSDSIGRSHNNCAIILNGNGRPCEALEHLDYARRHLSGTFGSAGVAFIDTTEAGVRFQMGEPGMVLRLLARYDAGWVSSQGLSLILLAWAAIHSGDDRRAHALVERARNAAGLREGEVRVDGLTAEATVATVLIALESSSEAASSRADEAAAMLTFDWTGGGPDDEALAIALAARAFAAAGAVARASDSLDRLEGLIQTLPSDYFAAGILEVRATFADDPTVAAGLLRDAVARFAGYPNALDRARCMRLLAAVIAEPDEQVALLREARAIAMECGSSLETARIESALRAHGIRPRAGRPKKSDGPATLSPREEEMTVLVAAGATNADIAGRLFLSERTVQDHISNALRKLGLSGRAGLAAWAAKNGMV